MLQGQQIEELMSLVFGLDRVALIHQFQHYPARFPIDFTPEFLERTPLERLQHIFLAMVLQTQRMPEELLVVSC